MSLACRPRARGWRRWLSCCAPSAAATPCSAGLRWPLFALGQLGELLDLPAAVTGLSPYTHLPAMPVEPFAALPELFLSALAAALTVAAWWRFRERDIG